MKRVLALSVLLLLLVARPAQTVGVEAWHDSAVPPSAFTAVLPPQAAHASQVSATRPTAAREFRGQPPAAETSTARRAVDAIPSLAPASRPSLGVSVSVTGELTGTASWFSSPADVSAAGPALRAAIGPGWRGTVVRVCAGMRCVRTVLGDWCGCVVGGSERVVDLDDGAFAALAPLAQGLQEVTISW